MARLDALYVADLLLEIGRRAQLEGGNPYKAKAYLRAADSLRHLVRPLAEVIAQDQLQSIPGIGEAIARRVIALHKNRTDPWLDKSREKYPSSLLERLDIPRLKPSAVIKLHQLLGINSLEDLERACRENRLKEVHGLGPALRRKVLESLAIARAGQGRLRMNRAQEALDHSIADLRQHRPELKDLTVAGDLRRGCEVISDLSLVACSREAKKPTSERLGVLALHIAPPDQFAAALLYATGKQDHIARLESLAVRKGLSLTQAGLRKGMRRIATHTEFNFYKALGLQFIPPELREGRDEVELARKNRLPKLVEESDLKGLLHIHTDASDGVHSLAEIAEAARKRGYQYLAFPTTRNRRITREVFASKRLRPSMPQSTRSIGATARPSAFSKASNPTSAPTAPSTIPRRSSHASTSSSPASIASSGWTARAKRNALSPPSATHSPTSSAIPQGVCCSEGPAIRWTSSPCSKPAPGTASRWRSIATPTAWISTGVGTAGHSRLAAA